MIDPIFYFGGGNGTPILRATVFLHKHDYYGKKCTRLFVPIYPRDCVGDIISTVLISRVFPKSFKCNLFLMYPIAFNLTKSI